MQHNGKPVTIIFDLPTGGSGVVQISSQPRMAFDEMTLAKEAARLLSSPEVSDALKAYGATSP